ncbi:MAG TPA: cytochrome c biogenesis protein CcsA, partial [Alphaproteobacteria bacterium]
MIAEIGLYALVLAAVTSLLQGTVPLIGASRRRLAWMALADRAALVQLLLVAIAFGCLVAVFVLSDFSVRLVAANSHTAKPLLYKISGAWGNHEGSLLLWVLILAIFGAAVAGFGGALPATLKARVLAVQGLIGLGFHAFMLATSNPFARLDPAPLDGNDLNPLLQDPGLAFHPPMLYLGYVGLSVAYAFAVAALIEGRVDAAWARWVRPWTLAAWTALTAGIALGSWWAYYELGWGGWWFWDPVENASFMPWLAGTALLHSAVVVEKRDALKSWTVLLAILTFSLSLMGTFLVRSGV